jgi:lipopolysaccharide transport system ATP-binding protein
MTSDVIVTRDLTKVYRLYQRPAYKLLDLLGLCPAGASYYREHVALEDVNLTVGSGEKLAIIGRNGAGKSTLLKLVAGIIRATSGDVTVRGRVSNLLQLGTGFHPEFTGRQNVYANLAHQGLTGREADRAFDQILAFAEIEEYIDQPMKTYSTGMCSRLMFSASIVLNPQILIIDEILGVGDAYFAHKSFERMRELCSQSQTTLLLVTHDVYSALNLCDRFIWIDRGRVTFDGDGHTAIALYESSIKEQEERMLRQRTAAALSEGPRATEQQLVHVLLRSRNGFALRKPLAIDEIVLTGADGMIRTLVVAHGSPEWHLVPEGNLGPEEIVDGRRCRAIQTHGSIYHKAEWLVSLPAGVSVVAARVRWHYAGPDAVEFAVFSNTRDVRIRGDLTKAAGWQEQQFAAGGAAQELKPVAQTEYGTATVRVASVQLIDRTGSETSQVRHGDPLTVRVRLSINGNVAGRQITFVLGLTRQNTPYAVNIVDHHLHLPAIENECVLDVQLRAVQLGSGTWYLRVGIGEAGVFERAVIKHFALDDRWYHLFREGAQLDVLSVNHLDASGTFVVHPATFVVRPVVEDTTASQIQ